MVLDPMSALSLAGNIVQFVDFSSKIVSKGRRIYISANGALPKNLELEVVGIDLRRLARRLRNDEAKALHLSGEEKSLQIMSEECIDIAEELLGRLEELKVKSDAKHRGWKSLRQALKSVWNKEELNELSERLSLFRDELQFHILVSMKETMQLRDLSQSTRFDDLDEAAKTLLSSLLKNDEIFKSEINCQTLTITDLRLETRNLIQKEAKETRTEILNALRNSQFDTAARETSLSTISFKEVPVLGPGHSRIQNMILQSLRFPTMTDRYEAIKEAHAKTFKWIFQNPNNSDMPWNNFSDWLEHGNGIYWISGKAGSGKSTLMRYIHENPRFRQALQTWCGQSSDLTIATFFFWISGVLDQSSQVGLLRSLLYELLKSKRHLIEVTLPELWSSLRTSVSPVTYSQTYSWTLPRVTTCFQKLFSIISQDSEHVFLLIDGLDEYQGDPTDTIELLQSVISPNVKVCVSSRPWQAFEVAFKKAPKLRMEYLTYEDIKRFVDDKLLGNGQMQQLCIIDPVGAPKLVTEILEKAEGVFLWVTLVVKSLLNGLRNSDSISYLRKRLEEIPVEIEDLYSYMLSKIEPIYFEEGRRLFSIVSLAYHKEKNYSGDGICAFRLSFAMEDNADFFAPSKRWEECEITDKVERVNTRLKVCCAGLLEISKNDQLSYDIRQNRSVRYIHRTARDFFTPEYSWKWPTWIHPVITDNIPTRLMQANTIYLKAYLYENDDEIEGNFLHFDIYGFIERMMWLAQKSERETFYHHAEILDVFEEISNSRYSKLWDSAVRHTLGPAANDLFKGWSDDFLSLAILWNLDLYLERRLGSGKEVLKAKKGRPYLDYALRTLANPLEDSWDLKTISVLLKHGGNPNLKFSIRKGSPCGVLLQSTPWEAVIHMVHLYSGTSDDRLFPSVVAPLFELMITHGADPHASLTCHPDECDHDPEVTVPTVSVTSIVLQFQAKFPEESRRLLEILEAAKQESSSRNSTRLSRLKNKLKLRR